MRSFFFLCLLTFVIACSGIAEADVLLLKNNRYIDEATILRNDAGIIVIIHYGDRYRIPDYLIVKVSDTKPEQGSYIHPAQLLLNTSDYDHEDAYNYSDEEPEYDEEESDAASTRSSSSKQHPSKLIRRISNRSKSLSDATLHKRMTDRLPAFGSEEPASEFRLTIIIGANVGTGFYMMQAINNVVEENNYYFDFVDVPLQNKIVNDLNYDFIIAINNARRSQTGLELCFLNASAKGGDRNFGQNLTIPAFELSAYYKALIVHQGNVRFGFGANVGIIFVNGTLENYYSGIGYYDTYSQVEAQGLISKFFTSLEYDVSKHVALNFTLGIRLANLQNVKLINGSQSYDFGTDLDYSGVFLKAGLLLF